MASAVDVEEIKNILECKICLEKYENPKRLTCSHHFCKKCLEDIMVFKGDGSATITCPLRCTAQTILSNNQTLNDFGVSYDFKNMLDAFKVKDVKLTPQIPLCTYSKNCKKSTSVYCCDLFMCDRCYIKHKENEERNQHEGRVDLVFSEREGFRVLCEVHDSPCTHLCMDDTFLCEYCLCRDKNHKTHSKNAIATDVKRLKQALTSDLRKKEKVQQFQRATEEYILVSMKDFDSKLSARKEVCLSQYVEFLNEKEKTLKQEFKSMCDKNLAQYPCIVPGYHQEKLQKKNVELAVQKRRIVNTLARDNRMSLKCVDISLSETYSFLSEQPLGLLQCATIDDVFINDHPASTLTSNLETQIYKNSFSPTQGVECRFQDAVSEGKLTSDVKKREGKQSKAVSSSRSEIDEQNVVGDGVPFDRITPSLQWAIQRKLVYPVNTITISEAPSSKCAQPFFDIKIDNKFVGVLIFNLYADIAPVTCINFIALCTHEKGFGYKGSVLDVVWSGDCCFGGMFITDTQTKGKSFYGKPFKCENHTKKHNRSGLLSMGNYGGGYHDSRFFITFKAIPDYDGDNVVFGDITNESYLVLGQIENVGYDSPKKITIVNCGVL